MSGLREAMRMHRNGLKLREIANLLSTPDSPVHFTTVRYAIKRYKATGSNADRKRSGRPKTATTPKNRRKVKGRIDRNPNSKVNSIRKMGKAIGISPKSTHRILKKDLHLKSYKKTKAQKLSEAAKAKRMEKAQEFLQRFDNENH